ncbi:hypothetical protein BJX99DRAFT_230996 [Aspergillus californicus]
MIVNRPQRDEGIRIFFGTIGSGNQVIKDGLSRDRINSNLGGVLCFEMEAAGVVNLLNCLVIRGICDYADAHKNKAFQPIAAAAAAACAREIFVYLPCESKVNDREDFDERPSKLLPEQYQLYHESLGFEQLDSRHRTIKMAHVKTCQWLLTCPEYKSWLDPDDFDQHHGFFWMKGKPGAGKSTIMKFAFIQSARKIKNATVISFFFNARGEILEKSVTGMYRSLLFQMLDKLPDLRNVFDTRPTVSPRAGPVEWDIETLKHLLHNAIERLRDRQLILYIDALDECDEEEVRDMISFFEQLGELSVCRQFRLLICFSSRHYPHITIDWKVELILDDQDGHQQDISKYVHSELKTGRSKQAQEIKEDVITRSSGIFLWVVLVVNILQKECDRGHVHTLRRRLQEIPDGLHSLLKDILTRDNHNMRETLLCLQWILYARRPLTKQELYFAILAGTESNLAFLGEWTAEELSEEIFRKFVLDSSKGLAETTKSKKQTVQFIHESVRDFLRDDGLSNLNVGSIAPGPSHDALKQCCANYVDLDMSPCIPAFEDLPPAKSAESRSLVEKTSQRYPFLEYAVQNVLHHSNAAAEHGTVQKTFMDRFPIARWILKNNLFEIHKIRRYTESASLMYILAEANCAKLLEQLIEIGYTVPEPTERYNNPLIAAVMNQNEEAAIVLSFLFLNEKSFLELEGWPHQNMLSFGSARNRIKLVKLLLKFNVSQNHKNEALLRAVEEGHTDVVETLLQNGAEVGPTGHFGLDALFLAIDRGHESIVELLLESGTDLGPAGSRGETPLIYAARHQSLAIVRQLLDRGIDLEAQDRDGRTALSRAVENSSEGVVSLLLDRGAGIHSRDSSGRTSLFHVSASESLVDWNIREKIAELLLKTGADPNIYDNQGLTPLCFAARRIGAMGIFKKLLDASAKVVLDAVMG